jgi:hypothetical protein
MNLVVLQRSEHLLTPDDLDLAADMDHPAQKIDVLVGVDREHLALPLAGRRAEIREDSVSRRPAVLAILGTARRVPQGER